jgi:hypothetical protein
MAKENRSWGYDRIAGALANLGYKVCDQTIGNVLQRHGLPPAPSASARPHGQPSFAPRKVKKLKRPENTVSYPTRV